MTENEALLRLQKICSQQEKCLFDINRKLIEWKIPVNQAKSILDSKSFVRDKFRLNEWGRIKLEYALRQKKINEKIIQDALAEIDETTYHDLVVELLRKKSKTLKDKDISIIKAKLIRFVQSKGVEYNVIRQAFQTISKEDIHK